MTVDFDGVYQRRGWEGVAWRLEGWCRRWEPYTYLAPPDDDPDAPEDEWVGVETPCEGEWVDDPASGEVRAYMVGDDHVYIAAVEDLTPLAEDDYCAGCGQVGCGWG